MAKLIAVRLVVLLCCLSFQSCTSTKLIHPTKTNNSSWLDSIKINDNLEILIVGESDPIKLKVTDIAPTEIKGENGVVIPIEKVAKVEKRHYSWIKNTFLVMGLILIGGIADFKDSVDDLGCKTNCSSY